MSGVHQFVPMLHRGDAVGQHTMGLRDLLVERGIASEIYVELEDTETVGQTRLWDSYRREARPGDVLVYQFATASDMARRLAERPERLVVNYHNVTPPPLFATWDNELARHQVQAHVELAALAGRAALGVAVSEMNRSDLVETGFAATAVMPPIANLSLRAAGVRTGGVEPPRGGRVQGAGARWLSVGRLAPNKAVEDTIAALLAYRAVYDPEAQLVVVGKPAVESYARALSRYAADLGLADAVRFAGKISDEALETAYQHADVLVVTSKHEGFCLPVVEAMAHDVPVVAVGEGALPEVLGDAGVLVEGRDPLGLASAVHRVQTDAGWRAHLVASGQNRLPALGLAEAGPRLVELLSAVLERSEWPAGVQLRPIEADEGDAMPGVADPVAQAPMA
jgi:glycosyltransferase involved in cell wall biosynthesis